MTDESSMTLLTDWPPDLDPTGWLVTEKFRGCRAYWDGDQLWTREGNRIEAPDDFTRHLPGGVALDGELWAGRCPVETEARLAVQYGGRHWTDRIRYAVFDSPSAIGNWPSRMRVARAVLRPGSFAAFPVESRFCNGPGHLRSMLCELVEAGGEGLVLRHPTAKGYHAGRSVHALRVTPLNLNIL
jgi:DNA ligase-1